MNFDELLEKWTHAESEASRAHVDARAALREYREEPVECRRRKVEQALRARDTARARVEQLVACVFGSHRAADCEMCNAAASRLKP